MSDNNKATIVGNVSIIKPVEEFASGFTKQVVVVTTDDDKYPQDIAVEFVKDNIQKAATLVVGNRVRIQCDIRGSEYNGRHFINLNGWKVEVAGAVAAAAAPAPAPEDDGFGVESDETPDPF